MGAKKIDASNPDALARLNEMGGVPEVKQHHFDSFCQLIFKHAGIKLHHSKKSFTATRLARRLRVLQLDSWDDYIKHLLENRDHEVQHFVNVLTTNKTEFFRENAHFEYLTNTFLPDLCQRGHSGLNAWIAAASTGQEAYSLLMVAEQFKAKKGGNFNTRILATDIDTGVLSVAQQGVYPSELVERDVTPDLRKKYFRQGNGDNAGLYRFDPDLAESIKFRSHNLCHFNEKIRMNFDLIMLRNVLIYFDDETIEKVITKMLDHLNPHGILILGHCETIRDNVWNLDSPIQAVYRKV